MNEELRDLKASGSVNLSGGAYRDVNLSGSARLSGDVECQCFDASGSARVAGGVRCERFKTSGSTRVEGDVAAGEFQVSGAVALEKALIAKELRASGSLKVEGETKVEGEARVSGSASFGGALKARTVSASGSLRAAQGIECETLTVSGAMDVEGLINAGTTDISLAGQSRLDEIGGERVTVRRKGLFAALGIQLPLGLSGALTAGAIEANTISLEATRAKVVRGADVTIGAGCEIDRVEYSRSLSVEGDAVVREQVKVE